MKLFEIDEAIEEYVENAYSFAEENDGELPDDFEDALEALNLKRLDKVEGIALYVKNIEAEVSAVESQEKIFAARKKSLQNKLTSVKNYLKIALKGEKLKTDKVQVSYRSGESVQIVPQAKIPDQYLTVKTTSTPNKTELKKAIKAGEKIEGVELVKSSNISVK